MKIGLLTDSASQRSLPDALDLAAELELDYVELATGNWSNAPHLDLAALSESASARRDLVASLADRGLALSALNCSGNPLHPGSSGRAHDDVTRRTIALAPELGTDRVVMMSGLPAGPGDSHPNWITVAWPPETAELLEWQWNEVLIPYWQDLAAYARDHGVTRICVELHAHQLVYNVPTLLRLREAIGPIIGANYDPSHLVWMGADPIAAIDGLGDAIHHVHAKDTLLTEHSTLTSVLETRPFTDVSNRAWNYVTLGRGHDADFWRRFCDRLRANGYDDVLSIEHEDVALSQDDGIREAVGVLRDAVAAPVA
jgi:sugar phosphate isomerase/epimerase